MTYGHNREAYITEADVVSPYVSPCIMSEVLIIKSMDFLTSAENTI
jgi:hypothetical protein